MVMAGARGLLNKTEFMPTLLNVSKKTPSLYKKEMGTFNSKKETTLSVLWNSLFAPLFPENGVNPWRAIGVRIIIVRRGGPEGFICGIRIVLRSRRSIFSALRLEFPV